MPLMQVIVILVVIGVVLGLFNKFATIVDGRIKTIVNVVVILAVCIWLLKIFGLFNWGPHVGH